MPRKSIPSTTLVQAVRRYFGLHQRELAQLLGVSEAMIGHLEAGRKALPGAVLLRLSPLAVLLPATERARPATPVPEEPPPAAPAPGPLEARLDLCRHQASKLRRELRKLAAAQAQARRWQQVLPGLLAGLPTPGPAPEPAEAARARRWLLSRQQQAQALLHDADLAARYHLLRARAQALEAEAATLAALLEPAAPAGAAAG